MKRFKNIFAISAAGLTALILAAASGVFNAGAYSADAFVTTWKTDNAGTSNSTSITIPTSGSGYNYSVDWTCDGTIDQTGITGSVTHNYGTAGTYQVCITGAFPQIYISNAGDKSKILSVDQWGTGAWRSFVNAFYGADNLEVVAKDTPNLSAATSLTGMFRAATKLTGNGANWNWNTSNITATGSMFYGATRFNQPIGSWNVSKVTNAAQMFQAATSFNQDIGAWRWPTATTASVNLNGMFQNATNFNNGGNPSIGGWNVGRVTNMQNMFQNDCAFNQPIGNWDTSNVTTMASMFNGACVFNQPISDWVTTKVTNMANMFSGAREFNQPIGTWDVSNVTNMANMFRDTKFDQPIGGWNVGKVTDMQGMFFSSPFNQDISGWDVSKVINMSSMLRNTPFNQPIGEWNTSSVTNMSAMFASATHFNQDISAWDVSKVTNMSSMFSVAAVFNQPIGSWSTGAVTNMQNMFGSAKLFDQNLANWDVSNLTNAVTMFRSAGLSRSNYDATLIGWDAQNLQPGTTFDAGNSKYCLAGDARANMIASDGWMINDSGVDCELTISITAPTKIKNQPITDTTIKITDLLGVNAADVTIGTSSTANPTNLNCTQVSTTEVSCTVEINSSGFLAISATDVVGSVKTTHEDNYVIDTVKPTMPHVQVDTSTGVNSPTVTFSATDNVAIDHYEIDYVDASGNPQTMNPATSPVQLSLNPAELNNPPHTHTVTVRAYDTAGNMNEAAVSFPPIVTFSTPTTIKNSPINDATVTITSPAGNPLDNIQLHPGTTGASLGQCTGSDGETSAPYGSPVTCQILNISASGTLEVTARDSVTMAVGNNRDDFIIETNAPRIHVNAPTKISNQAITNTTITVSDDYGINASNVTISAVNTTGDFSISNINCVQTNASRVDCTLQIDGNNGTGDLRIAARDLAGNTTVRNETGYIIDTVAPSGTLTQPTETIDTNPEFSGTINDPSATIMVLIGGEEHPAVNNSDGTWSLAAGSLTSPLVVGSHEVSLRLTDALGNTHTTDSQTITILRSDADMPTVNPVESQGGQPKITGTYDSANSQSLSVTIGGATYVLGEDAELTTDGDNWMLDLSSLAPPLEPGEYDIVVEITTRAGDTVTDDTSDELTITAMPDPEDSEGSTVPTEPTNPELSDTGMSLWLIVAIGLSIVLAASGILLYRRRRT